MSEAPTAWSLHASCRGENGRKGGVFKAYSTQDHSQGLEGGSFRPGQGERRQPANGITSDPPAAGDCSEGDGTLQALPSIVIGSRLARSVKRG